VAESNREIVALLYDCFRRRDNETPFEYLSEDIEWNAGGTEVLDMDGVYRGHDGVRKFWRRWLSAWEKIEWTEEIEDLDDGRVRAVVHQRNKGRDFGAWIDQRPYAQTWTLENGKVTRMDFEWLENK
jgi:ketosteroid isomerase-like protein